MEQNKIVPAIRFKGFEKEWEIESVKNISNVYDGIHHTPKYTDKGVMFLSVENIKTLKSNKYVSEEDFIKDYAVYPEKGDVLMTRIGDIGTANIVETDIKIAYYVSLALFKKNKLNPYFFQQNITSISFQKELFHRTLHIAFPKKINKNEIEKVKVIFPQNFLEQTQIGNFFKTIDAQITLHEQKHQKLVNLKSAMLEKMFPKEGANVPEIRFKGFTDEWDEKELGELIFERKVLQKISNEAPILAFAAGQGVIHRSQRKSNNRDHLTKDQSNKTYLLTEFDDIVYNPANLKYGAIDRNKYGRGVISPIYVTFITEQIPSFIELVVKSEKFKIRALQYEEGTVVKRQSVKPENLLSLKVNFSRSLQEQQKIGAYFENLDHLIQQTKTQINKYKNIKQALLQKMFV